MGHQVTAGDGAFCPLPHPRVLAKRLANGKNCISAIGLEKLCSKCKEFWPADTEFFYSVPAEADGLNSWCKACYREWRASWTEERRAA